MCVCVLLILIYLFICLLIPSETVYFLGGMRSKSRGELMKDSDLLGSVCVCQECFAGSGVRLGVEVGRCGGGGADSVVGGGGGRGKWG